MTFANWRPLGRTSARWIFACAYGSLWTEQQAGRGKHRLGYPPPLYDVPYRPLRGLGATAARRRPSLDQQNQAEFGMPRGSRWRSSARCAAARGGCGAARQNARLFFSLSLSALSAKLGRAAPAAGRPERSQRSQRQPRWRRDPRSHSAHSAHSGDSVVAIFQASAPAAAISIPSGSARRRRGAAATAPADSYCCCLRRHLSVTSGEQLRHRAKPSQATTPRPRNALRGTRRRRATLISVVAGRGGALL